MSFASSVNPMIPKLVDSVACLHPWRVAAIFQCKATAIPHDGESRTAGLRRRSSVIQSRRARFLRRLQCAAAWLPLRLLHPDA
jgi:hypothetical protein